MTSIWADEADLEFAEGDDSEGLYDNSEGDDEESRSDERQRRARARRIAQARQRARARGRGQVVSASPRPIAQRAVSAIKNLDLETKVQEDNFRRATAAQNKRMSRSEYAAVASVLANQFIQSFNGPDNKFARAAIQASPLLLLAPQRNGNGIEAIVKDPRVIGGAGVLGLVLLGEQRSRNSSVRQVDVLGPSELVVKEQDVFLANVLDGAGKALNTAVVWASDKTAVASIDATTGAVEAKLPGVTIITAAAGGVSARVRLKVVAGALANANAPVETAPE